MKIKTLDVQLKAGEEDELSDGEFLVYPSTFTRTPDAYGDVVAPTAFDATLKEWAESGNALPILYGHRMDDPDFYVGYAVDMGVDDHGWWVKGRFDTDSPKAAQVYRLVKGRRLNQLSFAFDVLDEGSVELEDGAKANELRKLKVYEASFVPVGANQDTSVVAVKSAIEALTACTSAASAPSLRGIITQLDEVTASLKTVLAQVEQDNTDSAEASGHTEVNDEEPNGAKSEEPRVNPSVDELSPTEKTMLDVLSGGKE